MLNIIKEILRQLRRDLLLWAFGAYFAIIMLVLALSGEFDLDACGSLAYGAYVGDSLTLILPIAAGIITSRGCGCDLRDKTANYEVLFGKRRYEVYFGRFFASLIFVFILTAVITLLPILFLTVKNGWGGSLAADKALTIFGMLFPILFRAVCFYTALSFLASHDIVPMIIALIGSGLLMVSAAIMAEMDYPLTWHTAVTDLMRLLDFSNTGSSFFKGRDITVYKVDLPVKLIVRMLLTSFGIGSAWLFGGYAIFRKRDIS